VRQLRWHEKLRRRKSEGGAGIHFPHTPFSSRPARAEFLKINFRIFVKKGSDFVQKVPHQFSASPGRRFFGRGLDFLKELM